MDVKKIMLLVGALIVAGISALFVRTLVNDSGTPQVQAAVVEQTGPKVLVATRALPIGTILTADAFKYQPWPKDLLDNAYHLEKETNIESLNGKVVRFTIPAGQPVTKGNIVGPGERGFLAAALTPGMRAITVSISNTSGVAGFVFPGDRVDMILTHGVGFAGDSESGIVSDKLRVAETIMRNVRVLAIDQRTDDGQESPKSGRTVTFEVSPKFVEKISVAQTLGTISLSLRPLAENAAELERAIAAGEIEVGDDQSSDADRVMQLASMIEPNDRNPTFTTGGEVSRFASTTDPRPSTARGRRAEASVRVYRGNKSTDVAAGEFSGGAQ